MTKTQLIFNKFQIVKLHYKKMGFINLGSYIGQRIFKSKSNLLKVHFPNYNTPIYLRNNASDTQIFTQIFLREELHVTLGTVPATIIDGGANIGLASVYLKNRYPDAMIYAVEPDSSNFELLIKNTKPYGNIICYNNAIWNKNIKLKIVNKEAGNESFVVSEIDENEIRNDAINAITINEIIKLNNIRKVELLKLDIEGSESKVFADNYFEWLAITDNMLVEIHNWIDNEAEKIVMAAVNGIFKSKMVGEYHFFSKL